MELEKKIQVEQMGMLPGRFYLVLEPMKDEEVEDSSGFTLRIYSTAYADVEGAASEHVESTYVVVQGILGQLEDQFDDVFAKGIERVTMESVQYTDKEENIDPEQLEESRRISDNIIEVDFGGGNVH